MGGDAAVGLAGGHSLQDEGGGQPSPGPVKVGRRGQGATDTSCGYPAMASDGLVGTQVFKVEGEGVLGCASLRWHWDWKEPAVGRS